MNNYNIRRNIATGVAALTLLLTSCESYFLEPDSPQYIADNISIVDAKSAEAALLGVYSALQHSEYYGGDGFQSAVNLAGGELIWVGTQNHYNTFVTHTYRADNRTLNDSWQAIHKVVNGANHIIAKVPLLNETGLTDQQRNQLLGEAYTLRALAQFDLARAWGNIPLVLQPTLNATDFSGLKQSNRQEVYKQVLSDLDKAEQLIGNNSNINRVTLPAIYAFKARVYLYTEQWDKAEAYASKVIANTAFGLVSWQTILSGKNTRESVWELAFSTADKSSYFSVWSSDAYRNTLAPSKALYKRLRDPLIGGARSALIKDVSTPAKTDFYVQLLYWRSNNDNPTYLFRLAEQYLIRSEARSKKETPDLVGALADLNAVRNRSSIASFESTSREEILLAIEEERRVEFAFEPHRWFDLVRTGRVGTVLGVNDTQKWIFPIPYNDLAADPALVQNPGY